MTTDSEFTYRNAQEKRNVIPHARTRALTNGSRTVSGHTGSQGAVSGHTRSHGSSQRSHRVTRSGQHDCLVRGTVVYVYLCICLCIVIMYESTTQNVTNTFSPWPTYIAEDAAERHANKRTYINSTARVTTILRPGWRAVPRTPAAAGGGQRGDHTGPAAPPER